MSGEHIIHKMDKTETRLLKKMQKGIRDILSDKINSGAVYELVDAIYSAVQDVILDHDAIIGMGLDPHPNVDFEFVNRPEFITLVKKVVSKTRQRNLSEEMLNVLVHTFREWYTHCRD